MLTSRRLWVGSLSILVLSASLVRAQLPMTDHMALFMRDREPPYRGPGYRSAQRGGTPIQFPSHGIQLLSWLPLPDLDPIANSANSCFGYVNETGREYAIIGISTGTAFVDITDPTNPDVINVIAGPNSLWRDVKVFRDYCYAVSEGGSGIQVIDMSMIELGIVQLVNTVTISGTVTTTSTHTLAVNPASGRLYRCGGSGISTPNGLRIYNLLPNPASPTFAGAWHTRYVHEAQVVNFTTGAHAGREIAFCFSEVTSGGGAAGLNILDVTNPASISQVGFTNYTNASFCHQGWLTEDRTRLYLNDETDGLPRTRIINVANLASPFEEGHFCIGSTAIDHNLHTRGNLIFESNYRNGLSVFDASKPLAPVRIAYFDTYPQSDTASYNGLWNNYPFFPSGVVIGSDIEKGLFIWRVDCNENGVPDDADIAGADSLDENENDIPDECDADADCNRNGITDACEPDCNADLVPDACEPDCQPNGIADPCEIALQPALDCNHDNIIDACTLAAGGHDCNANAIIDECDLYFDFTHDSPQKGPIGGDPPSPQSFTLADPPAPRGDVLLLIAARGDFSAAIENIAVLINGIPVGTVFDYMAPRDCENPASFDQLTFTAEEFDALLTGGDLLIDLIASEAVATTACGGASFAEVTLSYRGVRPGADCNATLTPDDCEKGDADGDHLITLNDHHSGATCATGPCLPDPCNPSAYGDPCCRLLDFDSDGDADLADFAAFQRALTAP